MLSAGIKDQAKSNKFNIATGQSSCSFHSRKVDTALNTTLLYEGLNANDTANYLQHHRVNKKKIPPISIQMAYILPTEQHQSCNT